MRCRACHPGDILQCELQAHGPETLHQAMPRKNSIVYQREKEPVKWRETWLPPEVEAGYAEWLHRQAMETTGKLFSEVFQQEAGLRRAM